MRALRRSLSVAAVAVAACVAGYPSLGTSTQEVISVNATMYDFGTFPVGMSSTSGPITISPQSPSDDDNVTFVGMATNCPDFTVQPAGQLPAHIFYNCTQTGGSGSMTTCTPETFQFTTRFAPSFAGPQSCNVRIEYTAAGAGSGTGSNMASKFVMLQGSGAVPPFQMKVTPTELAFGDVRVGGTSAGQAVMIQNTGSMALTLQGMINGPYSVSGSLASHTLDAGSGELHQVACMPTIAGDASGTLSLTTVQGPTASVNLSCRGIVTTLDVQPSPVRFDYALVGAAPADEIVTIANGSASPVVMLSNFRFASGTSSEVSFVGGVPGTTTLDSGGSLQVLLHYAADTAHPLGPLGALVFAADGIDQNVAINGEAELGSIGTNPASVDFGPICPGGGVVMRDVTIFANAAGDVSVSSLTPPTAPAVGVPDASGTLKGNHGSELMAHVTLTPGSPSTIDDKFVINNNVPGTPTHEVPITATVLAAGITPSPDALHFGPSMTNVTTTGREIVLSNCGAGTLSVTGAGSYGADAADFTIVSPANAQRDLAPAESMTFLVVMTPHTPGNKTAELRIEHSQGTTTVNLDGTGYGGDEGGGGKDRETYYACSVGGGAARAWPIALALLALRRRRR